MKIILDLSKSHSNYYWNNKKELEDYINYMKEVLWEFHNWVYINKDIDDNYCDRFFDILDMFTSYEIKKESEDEK